MKSFCEILRELREDRDMTQADVANLLGTSQQYYSKYETGKYEIVNNAFRCCTGFNDFPDLGKIGRCIMSAVFTGDHSALDDLGKVFPFCIIQDRSQFSGIPILGTVRARSTNVLKAFIFGGNEMAHVVSLP